MKKQKIKLPLLLLGIFLCSCTNDVKILKVVRNKEGNKIVPVNSDNDFNRKFIGIRDFENKHFDTILLINELLSFEYDLRRSSVKETCYSLNSSSLGNEKNIDVNIEALYLINYLIDSTLIHTPCPKLSSNCNNNEYIVSNAYKAYREWFEIVKRNGLGYIRDREMYPLDKTCVYWSCE